MDDDFNSSGGLAALFELVRTVNTARDAGATDAELKPAQDTLRTLTGVLGLRLAEKKVSSGGLGQVHRPAGRSPDRDAQTEELGHVRPDP